MEDTNNKSRSNDQVEVDNPKRTRDRKQKNIATVLTGMVNNAIESELYASTKKGELFDKKHLIDVLNKEIQQKWDWDFIRWLNEILWKSSWELKWEDIEDRWLDSSWTVKEFVSRELNKQFNDKGKKETVIVRSFLEKLYWELDWKSDKYLLDVMKLFKKKIYDWTDIKFWKTDSKSRSYTFSQLDKILSTFQNWLTGEYLKSWTQLLSWLSLTNKEIFNSMVTSKEITQYDYNTLKSWLLKAEWDAKNLINILTKAESISWISEDISIIEKNIERIPKLIWVPWLWNLFSWYEWTTDQLDEIIKKNKLKKDWEDEKRAYIRAYLFFIKKKLTKSWDENKVKLSKVLDKLVIKDKLFDLWALDQNDQQILLDSSIDNMFTAKFEADFKDLTWLEASSYKSFLKDHLLNLNTNKPLTISSWDWKHQINLKFKYKRLIWTDIEEIDDLNDLNQVFDFALELKNDKYISEVKSIFPERFFNIWEHQNITDSTILEYSSPDRWVLEWTASYDSQFYGWLAHKVLIFTEQWTWKQIFIPEKELDWTKFKVLDNSWLQLRQTDISSFAFWYVALNSFWNLPDKLQENAIKLARENYIKTLENGISNNLSDETDSVQTNDSNSTVTRNDDEDNSEDKYSDFLKELNRRWWDKDNFEFTNVEDLFQKQDNFFVFMRCMEDTDFGGWVWLKVGFIIEKDNDWVYSMRLKLQEANYKLSWLQHYVPSEWQPAVELNKKSMVNIRSMFFDQVYKIQKIGDWNDFVKYMWTISKWDDNKKFSIWAQKWQDVEMSWSEIKKKWWEKISYVCKQYPVWQDAQWNVEYNLQAFRVEFKWNGVEVSYENWGYRMFMDYSSFAIFCSERKLEPMTEQFYKQEKKDKWWWVPFKEPIKFLWLSATLETFKMFKDNILWKMKSKDEHWAAKLYYKLLNSWVYKWLASVAWVVTFWALTEPLKDLGIEAQSDLDSKIWNTVEWHRNKLLREWWTHAKKAVDVIIKDIFDQSDNIYRKNPLKALWYMFVAMDKWGWLYYRWLSKNIWQWMWVKCILWPDHQKKYIEKTEALRTKLKSDPTNQSIHDALQKSEGWYLRDNIWKPEFFTIFWSKVNVETEKLFLKVTNNWATVEEAMDWERNKNAFNDQYMTFKWYLKDARWPATMAALRAMNWRVEEEEEYIKWYWCMLAPMITWLHQHIWWVEYWEYYKKASRSIGFPFGTYIMDLNWPDKIVKILDFVSIKLWLKDTDIFSKKVGWSKDKVDYFNVWKNSNITKIVNNLFEWWEKNWASVVNMLNNESLQFSSLYQNIDEDNSPGLTLGMKEAVKEYYNSKINDTDDWTRTTRDDVTLFPSFYKKSILNIGAWAFKHIMKPDNLRSMGKWWDGMWWAMKDKFEELASFWELDKVKFEFLLNKFKTWFEPVMKDRMYDLVSDIARAKKFMESWDREFAEICLNESITKYFMRINSPQKIPQEVEDAYKSMEQVLVNNIHQITLNDIESIFWKKYAKYSEHAYSTANRTNTKHRIDWNNDKIRWRNHKVKRPNIGDELLSDLSNPNDNLFM